MYTDITYVFRRRDGVIGYHCGEMPTGMEIIEERTVLHPETGYDLMRISDEEIFSAVWLRDGDVPENYIEVIHEDPVPPEPNGDEEVDNG